MSSRLRIVVTGLIAQYPLGGVTWDYLQYVLGLARLGHDVYYIEDTGQWPYAPSEDGLAKGCDYNVEYLDGLFRRFGLENRWAYRFPWQSQWFGLPEATRKDVVEATDLLINISGTLEHPEEYRGAGIMAYIDSDPVFTQVKIASGNDYFRKLIEQHDVLFSFGEHHSNKTPQTGHDWLPTRQPVVLSEWQPQPSHRDVFTTVMNWSSYKPIEFEGKAYGQKDIEFKRFMDLPALVAPTVLELAAAQGKEQKLPRELLVHRGWKLVDPREVCPDLDGYRDYIRSSRAEWSVAKNGYVQGQSGWFSCRSACYLAAARPVVVQETGFSKVLPVGEGLLAFTTPEEAQDGIRQVEADYDRHSRAARAIAEECFDSDKVLTQLVERAMEVGA
ncbi:MAG: glycosyltransferase family 1 protein [Planctomycetota bacterium]